MVCAQWLEFEEKLDEVLEEIYSKKGYEDVEGFAVVEGITFVIHDDRRNGIELHYAMIAYYFEREVQDYVVE